MTRVRRRATRAVRRSGWPRATRAGRICSETTTWFRKTHGYQIPVQSSFMKPRATCSFVIAPWIDPGSRSFPTRRHAERRVRRRGEGIASSARGDLRVLLVNALIDDRAHRRRRGTRMHGGRLQQEGVAGGEQAGGEQQRSHVRRSVERASTSERSEIQDRSKGQ